MQRGHKGRQPLHRTEGLVRAKSLGAVTEVVLSRRLHQ